jgi:hypothetical protein
METFVVIKCDEDNNGKEQFARAKAQRRITRRSDQGNGRHHSSPPTLTRSKALLLAALKVWELKNRVAE